MKIEDFLSEVAKLGIDFFTGVPDSQLKALCDDLMYEYGIGDRHVIAANEGAACGLAAGHYLATGKPALVYMQNSGIGNAVNPICSLLNDKVYAIPALFVVGWRGEPGVKDEPQHVFQGEITRKLLDCLKIQNYVLSEDTTVNELREDIEEIRAIFTQGKQAAFVIRKGALVTQNKLKYENTYPMSREEVVSTVCENAKADDIFVSTTGKLSRELFETRAHMGQSHQSDFLTVGSMGHSCMIALGIAKEKPDRRVICMDGDGAVLMHTGSVAVLGANQPKNLLHILINNGAHETVGGMPTVSKSIDYPMLAKACGYQHTYQAENKEDLVKALKEVEGMEGPIFLEVRTNLLSRADLGRPTTTPTQNKEAFMSFVREGAEK